MPAAKSDDLSLIPLREHLGEGKSHLLYYLECTLFHLLESRKGHRSLLVSTGFIKWTLISLKHHHS